MNNRQALVSVVTPFYNTGKYLPECIESVLAQTYHNFEYILVNNCSTDNSLAIAKEYALRDRRISVVNNGAFLTQVENYNHALRQISPESKYCKIVQADDWIFPHCLEQMVKVASENPSVAIVGAYQLQDPNVLCDGLPYPSTVVSGREIFRLYLLESRYVFGTPSSHLFCSDVVRGRNPFYDGTSLFEDSEACFEILRDHDFGFVHQVLTFSRTENESITSSIRGFKPYMPLPLIILVKYGGQFLTPQEYEACYRSIAMPYFEYLGKCVLTGRNEEFWRYHSKSLESIGFCLDRRALRMLAARAIVGAAMEPIAKAGHGIYTALSGAIARTRGK